MDPKQELIRHYRWLRQYGLNDSHSGNASVRDGDVVWITPTGACADTLTPEQLVRCSLDTPGEGASLDAPLHLAVYRAVPGTGAVLHSHGPHTVGLTLAGDDDYVPVDFEGQYYFPRVPVIDIPYARYVAEAPQRVAEALRESVIAVVRGHGVYARAETLNLAYKWSCSLEQSARTDFVARLGRPGPTAE